MTPRQHQERALAAAQERQARSLLAAQDKYASALLAAQERLIRALLAQRLTDTEIQRRTGVERRQVAKVRAALRIPKVAQSEWRALMDPPQGRQIRVLLAEGYTDAEIARRTGVHRSTVSRARRIGRFGPPSIPPDGRSHRRLPAHGQSLTERWAARLQLVDGGHLVWTGTMSRPVGGSPVLKVQQHNVSAGKLSFRWAAGREPVGLVLPVCGLPGCLAPAHLTDEPQRTATRRAVRTVVVQRRAPETCRRGHDSAVHGRFDPDGHYRCLACHNAEDRTRRTAASTTPKENQA